MDKPRDMTPKAFERAKARGEFDQGQHEDRTRDASHPVCVTARRIRAEFARQSGAHRAPGHPEVEQLVAKVTAAHEERHAEGDEGPSDEEIRGMVKEALAAGKAERSKPQASA